MGEAATVSTEISLSQPADFETAIGATKFGKFNVILLILTLPAGCVPVFETTTMSYVFPVAQCDLNLTLNEKGSLNAYTFMGMISSGFLWGFLCDTLGRRKIMIVGYIVNGIIVLASGFSQNYPFLVTTKYFGGFVATGPFSAMTSYLSEFHRSEYRAKVQLVRGMSVSCGVLILSFTAWAVLPIKMNILLFDYLVLHAWNVFLMLSGIPCLIGMLFMIFMPESPKFLMTVGKNEEALKVFQLVYSLNTGRSRDLYPITELIDETKIDRKGSKHGGHVTANRSKKLAMKEGWSQIRPICFPPFLKDIILVCFLQSFNMMSVNTLRLWMPQIFQSIHDYQYYHNGSSTDLCEMLSMIHRNKKEQFTNGTCQVHESSNVYVHTVVISVTTIVVFLVALLIIKKVGSKLLLGTLPIIAGGSSLSIYFAKDTATTLALASVFLSMGSVCVHCTLIVVIDLFPTTLRTVAISLVMTSGRLATIIGNVVFPRLLKMGCAPPFIALTTITLGACILVLFLPNTEKKALI